MHYERVQKKLALLLFALALLPIAMARADSVTELKVTAAFLYNFTKFIKWPAKTFNSPTDPLTICAFGKQPFYGILAETLDGKTAENHPLAPRAIKTDDDVKGCQVLFISEPELSSHLILLTSGTLEGVLVVSESQNAKSAAGNDAIITLVLESNRVRFRINNTAAEKAGLTISSRLLSLAISVE